MKYLFTSCVAFFATATFASAQGAYSIQESGDIFGDIVRNNQVNSSCVLSSPFNMGFVNSNTSPIMNGVFQVLNIGTASYPTYNSDVIVGYEYNADVQSYSAICLNFGFISSYAASTTLTPNSLTMVAYDYAPCIETKLPKGTYTFQATATPVGGGSTPGTFMFETCTAGIWTVQFNLALPKPEGATRTLTFAHDTKVRWLLLNTGAETASAVITAKYYNSGS